MTKEIWFDPSFGASGDMILGAFVSLGVDPDSLVDSLDSLDVSGWSIDVSDTVRCGITATRVRVTTQEQHHHRTWKSIDSMLALADLPYAVTEGARRTFRRLGEIEATQHGVDLDEVHFHEVGAVDAIVDIVGAWICWDLIGQPEVACGPFGLGHGTVEAAHGTLPLPAPATIALLKGAPVVGLDVSGETVTPTGAAILTTMAARLGSLGSGTVISTGRGAGGRDPKHYPNALPAVQLSLSSPAPPSPNSIESCLLLSTNIDDSTGEVIAYTIQKLLEDGALDAWARPIVMKKGRPAVELCALTTSDLTSTLVARIMTETGTLGVRHTPCTRSVADRATTTVHLDGHPIRIKTSASGSKPEFDDLTRVAQETGKPIRLIATEALRVLDNRTSSSRSGISPSEEADS